ncbi:MAG: hypothetical protein MJE68_21145, partial [Proteobacteria bacterium]|nr:hypothetical protein [Pseudomonadota bacterium]
GGVGFEAAIVTIVYRLGAIVLNSPAPCHDWWYESPLSLLHGALQKSLLSAVESVAGRLSNQL